MSKIIAIGGGEIGRPGYPIETKKIDKEIIRLSGKKHPKLIFIPTASGDAQSYIEPAHKHFGQRLGCKVESLRLVKNRPPLKIIRQIIFSADIIYVGGGNTLRMMNVWRRIGFDKILKLAYKKNIVLAGISAGSICWFASGNSDSRRFTNKKAEYILVKGLGLIKAINCPHYDKEKGRKKSLAKMAKRTNMPAIALDNCAAIEIVDDQYRMIVSY